MAARCKAIRQRNPKTGKPVTTLNGLLLFAVVMTCLAGRKLVVDIRTANQHLKICCTGSPALYFQHSRLWRSLSSFDGGVSVLNLPIHRSGANRRLNSMRNGIPQLDTVAMESCVPLGIDGQGRDFWPQTRRGCLTPKRSTQYSFPESGSHWTKGPSWNSSSMIWHNGDFHQRRNTHWQTCPLSCRHCQSTVSHST